MAPVIKARFTDYTESITQALDALFSRNGNKTIPQTGLIILKPNLTTASPPPVTTPVDFVHGVYHYLRGKTSATIAIGEGCGNGNTLKLYKKLGYTDFAEQEGLELIDFNTAETVLVHNEQAFSLKSFHLPVILQNAYLISLPILKDHSFTRTTAAMKNLFGIAPGRFYKGSWNKSKLHSPSTDLSVVDICRYKKPDLSIVDAVTALTGSHLSGRPKGLNTILAGLDPVAVDAVGSALLGHDPRKLEYLTRAEGLIGSMKNVDLVEV